jgi:hypothetical protein
VLLFASVLLYWPDLLLGFCFLGLWWLLVVNVRVPEFECLYFLLLLSLPLGCECPDMSEEVLEFGAHHMRGG